MKQKPIKAVNGWAVVDKDGIWCVDIERHEATCLAKQCGPNHRVIPVRIVPIRKRKAKGKVTK